MYAITISEIEIPFLHDAAMVCDMKNYNLRSIHVDPSGECAISYWGDISLADSAIILQNYLTEDVDLDECYCMVKEGSYRKWFKSDDPKHPNGYTTLYTPDGIDYRTLSNRL